MEGDREDLIKTYHTVAKTDLLRRRARNGENGGDQVTG